MTLVTDEGARSEVDANDADIYYEQPMIHRNDDPFTKQLRDAIDPEHKKLFDRSISINLRIEEIELIRWALEDYAKMRIVYALNLQAERVAVENDLDRNEVLTKIGTAFTEIERFDLVFERLHAKLNEAIAEELRRDDREPPLI